MIKKDDELARLRVPELGAVICACRKNPRTVGTKCAVPDPILMLKGGGELARGSIPELGGVVHAYRQDPSTVRTKQGVQDTTNMIKRGNESAGCRIPELGAVICACRQNPRAVRTERRAYDLTLMVKRGDGKRQRLFTVDNQFLKESLRGNWIFRVELDRTRQKSDSFSPLSQPELTLGLVEACPARLPQLVVEFPGHFRYACSFRPGQRRVLLGSLTVALGLQPLKASNNCQNTDRGHDRVANPRSGLPAPVSLGNARVNVVSLFTAKRRSKVFEQLFTFGQVKSRFEQVIRLFSAAQPQLKARIQPIPHPQKLAVFFQPLFDTLPFSKQCFVCDAHGNLALRIRVRDQQPLL